MRLHKKNLQTFIILLGIVIALLVFLAIHFDYTTMSYSKSNPTPSFRLFVK